MKNVAIYIFDEVEVLDFAGPFEVFSVAGRSNPLYNVYTVAQELKPISARNGLSINPRYDFADCPKPDILVVPGGRGTRTEMEKSEVLDWIRQNQASLVLSVCTGSLILGKAGLLDSGGMATTHHLAFEELRAVAPEVQLAIDARLVDRGNLITAAGVSAGIDASLYVLEREFGRERALETARYIEYDSKMWPV